jgi:hypothetical protein
MNPFVWMAQQVANIFGRSAGKLLSAGTNVFTVTTPEVYAPIDSKNAIDEGFNASTPVYSIVMKDAKKFGSIPIYLYSANKREEKSGRVSKLLKSAAIPEVLRLLHETKAMSKLSDGGKAQALTNLLNRPNKYQGQDLFFTTVRAYYKNCGEAMIWLNRGDLEPYRLPDGTLDDKAIDRLPVIEMYVLPSNLLTAIPDPTNLWGILGWVLEVGQRVYIRAGDVIHWKNVNLEFDASTRAHLRGMSPLKPGAKTTAEGNSLSKYSMRSAQNDGAKAVLFNESMNAMTSTQQADVKRVVDAKINNNDVAGTVATLQGKWGVANLAQSSKDLEVLDKKKFNWQEMCFLLDVPVEFFDPAVIQANKKQAQLGWITNDIIPACKQFNGELNRVLLKAFGLDGTGLIASDYSELPEIQEAAILAAKTLQEIWSIEPDAIRELLGFEPLGELFAEPWIPTGGRTPISHMQSPEDEIATELEMQRINDSRGAGAE